MPDRHSRRDSVGIDDDIRADAFRRERHVLLSVKHAHRTLLPMATGKLVSDLRDANGPDADLHEASSGLIGGNHDLVDDARLRRLCGNREILLRFRGERRHDNFLAADFRPWNRPEVGRFPHEHIVRGNACSFGHKTIRLELFVRPGLHAEAFPRVRNLECFRLSSESPHLFVCKRPEVHRAEQTAIDRALVHDHGILLVEARVTRNGDHGVDTRGQHPEFQVLHRSGDANRLLRVVEHVCHGIHSQGVIRDVHTHGLLAHRGLVGVTRRLVVIRERNNRGANTKNHRRVNFAVSPRASVDGVLEVIHGHCNHGGLFFLAIDILNHTLDRQVRKRVFVLLEKCSDVPLPDRQSLFRLRGHLTKLVLLRSRIPFLDNKQRTADPAGICKYPQLLILVVHHDRDFIHDTRLSPQPANRLRQAAWLAMDTNPRPVDEHLGGTWHNRRRDLDQVFRRPLVEKLFNGIRRGTDRNVRHHRNVLHETDRAPFRRFCRAHHAPMSVVELPGFGQLPFPSDRRIQPPQMGQRRRKCKPVEHLRNPGPHRGLRVSSPVARRKRVLQAIRDDSRLDGATRKADVAVLVIFTLEIPHGIPVELPKQLPEEPTHERSGQIQALVPKMITIIGGSATQGHRQQSVDHVSQEIRLLELVSFVDPDVGQELPPQNVPRKSDPALAHGVLVGATLADEIECDALIHDARGLLDGGHERRHHFVVLEIVHDVAHHFAIVLEAERPEDDDDGNVLLDVRKIRDQKVGPRALRRALGKHLHH
mmetsp:Transcript_4384/g.10739  ORF Transcript_4384/g.10739 Transcript_4384/m.10739 type:complete len:763 (+) Transcript_4384:725-3013(+)